MEKIDGGGLQEHHRRFPMSRAMSAIARHLIDYQSILMKDHFMGKAKIV